MAERRPAPGGGTAAAWVCALAAALAEMAAAFTLAGERYAAAHERMRVVGERAAQLREEALALGQRELESYRPVLEALALQADAPDRQRRLTEALSLAAEAPLAIVRAAAEVAELAAEGAAGGNDHLRGDAITGVLLAEAACRSAGCLVELNLADRAGDPRLEEVSELVARASACRTGVA